MVTRKGLPSLAALGLVLISCCFSYSQSIDTVKLKKYEYIVLFQVSGTTIDYLTSTANQSLVMELKPLKLKNIIDCVKLLEDKGWELVNFNFAQTDLITTHEATLRKRRY